MERQRKNQTVKIRVTEEEKRVWEELARKTGLSLSELIRERMNKLREPNTFIVKRANERHLKELIRQINLVGNNVNQIARWVNTYKEKAEAGKVTKRLEFIAGFLREVRELAHKMAK